MGRYQDLPNRTDYYYVDDSTITSAGFNICRQRRVCAFVGGTGFPKQVVCASKCYVFTVPEGVTNIVIEAWGAGGSGSGQTGNCCGVGAGGGGGGYASASIVTAPGCQYTICVGGGADFGVGDQCAPCSNYGCGCTGGLTFVTGYNLTNFCATPGCGGCAPSGGGQTRTEFTDGNNQPNYGCGYAIPTTGCVMTTRGSGGTNLGCAVNAQGGESYGGMGGGPGGGHAGIRVYQNCCRTIANGLPGHMPGGGGSGTMGQDNGGSCVCGGSGGPGLVKIWY
jgi:trimeric autotransporter adhesin